MVNSQHLLAGPLMVPLVVASLIGGCAVDQRNGAPANPTPKAKAESGAGPNGAAVTESKEHSKSTPSVAPSAVPTAPTAGGVGYYQDRQEKVLSERLTGTGVRVQRNADTIKLIVPGKIAFALNSEQIQPDFASVLDSVALVLKEYSKTIIDIKGYTDSTGSFEHNQQLSERRAQSVGSFLTARQIAAVRIRSAGFGPRNPLAGNDTENGRAQNRRVEIELVPMP